MAHEKEKETLRVMIEGWLRGRYGLDVVANLSPEKQGDVRQLPAPEDMIQPPERIPAVIYDEEVWYEWHPRTP